MRYILFLFLLLTFSSFTLKEKLNNSQIGSYIVTEQNNNISILIIKELTESKLVLEEITVPANQVELSKIVWKRWLEKANGATAWTLYEIDISKNILVKAYSQLQKKWVKLEESEYFFAKLLTLPLQKIEDKERKKNGTSPASEEPDLRKVWNPPLIFEGKKRERAQFEVFKTLWPKDNSPLSGCPIELYFDASNKAFPFPYWMEVKSPHYAFKIRVIDSGTGLFQKNL